jgi:hypothetical protein
MKGPLLIALTLLVLFGSTGCRKVGKGEVSGTVTEQGTGLPFPNVGVYIVRSKRSGESTRTDPTEVAHTVTDAGGHYSLPFNREFNRDYRIYCTPLPDLADTYTKESSKNLPTKNEKIDFTLPPFAYVKVSIHKASYTVTEDSYVQFDYRKTVHLNDPSYPIDSVIGVYRVIGNDNLAVSWIQFYNSTWKKEKDTVYIDKGDTLSYLINLD